MRAVVQRVSRAEVRVEGNVIDARDVRAGSGRLCGCGRDTEKKDEEVLHGEMIVDQAGS